MAAVEKLRKCLVLDDKSLNKTVGSLWFYQEMNTSHKKTSQTLESLTSLKYLWLLEEEIYSFMLRGVRRTSLVVARREIL